MLWQLAGSHAVFTAPEKAQASKFKSRNDITCP
jgi:hypothetical protein